MPLLSTSWASPPCICPSLNPIPDPAKFLSTFAPPVSILW